MAEPQKAEKSNVIPLVCGIGASAGGIEALQKFFTNLAPDTGVAYVVILHLAPDRKSELPSIIQRWTSMPIVQVIDHEKSKLLANHVYVISPDRKLEITDTDVGASSFEQPRGHRTAIDLFFRSLAVQHGDGFAVVLSGSGSDGALGARAVKEAGGLVLVQEPSEAQHPDMPKAVIATGVADLVLPVVDLARKLGELARDKRDLGQTVREPESAEPLSDDDERALRSVLELLRKRTGHDFSRYKRATVLRRLSRRMQLSRKLAIPDYLDYLRSDANEPGALLNDLLISVTTFFRDPEAWTSLQSTVIGPLVEMSEPGEQIRAWVVGCATGEEAYTLAMLFSEEMAQRKIERNFIIFASDVDDTALNVAREGLYPQAIVEDVSEARLARFFRVEDDHYRIAAELRDRLVFASHSVLRDPPFSRLHLVTCRNLLIYLNRELQEQVMSVFRYSCREHAHLFLGASETADEERFLPMDKKHRIFVTRPRAESAFALPDILPTAGSRNDRFQRDVRLPLRQSATEIHLAALESAAPPSVLVDDRWMVVHISETAAKFFLQSGGTPARRITDLVRPELRDDLHALLHRAGDKELPQMSPFVAVRFNGASHRVALLVQSRPQPPDNRPFALVTFLDGGEVGNETPLVEQEPTNELVRALSEKLRQAEQRLANIRDDQYATNEDLRAANEELQSLNEEYRSTTEELETSKEELQSINEELQTVNNELKLKLDEVSRAHSDLENLMAATDVATLFLDNELRIQRFTPKLGEIFNIKSRDFDRPFSDLTHHLDYADLETDARRVLSDLTPVEREIVSHSGQRFIARLRLYRTDGGRAIGGVVLTFIDVTAIIAAEAALRHSEVRLENELEAMRRLHRMTMTVANALSMNEALEAILDAAIELHGADMGCVQLFPSETKRLAMAVHRGLAAKFLGRFADVGEEDKSAFGRALRTRKVVRIEDVEIDPDYAPFRALARESRYRSIQAMPVLNRNGGIVAVISVHFRNVHVFNERDRQLSDLIAQPAAAMIESRTQQENLTKLNDVLAHRTTELESSQEKLARKAADLAEQDRHRDDFLAALGHELRNPLAAILSSIGVLNVPDARSEKALGILRRQVRNITRLVNDLLDTTRVKHGRLRLQCAAVDLNQAAAIALETVRMQANAKQIVLKSDLPKTPVIVSADPDRLAQILDNLLRNAVTYTDNGEVSVKVRQQDNFACVTIRDSGVGIDADDAPFVFGQYEQRDHGRRSAGLGLGLTLVKSLVEGHGGKISFRSDGANKGSEFWFTLPLVAAPAESSAYSVPVLNSQRRILVVDDQNDVADIFKVMLEGLGQTVVVAYDGATALTLARATHPQVALLDMSMGGMSGIELAQNLRREFPRERLVLIAMSGRGDIEPQARKAGVDHFFLKPVAPEELAAFLNGLGNGKD